MNIHEKYIKRCIQLAKNGLGTTYPNPLVGSVVVYKGSIIGEGWHYQSGMPHAEVNAINSVKNKSLLNDATIYVSLEPCSHFGKTPPCAHLIVSSGIKKVVVGSLDINEKVSGKGIAYLREHGCEVVTNILKEECDDLNKRFFTFHGKKRPYILLKWAQTSDGFIDKLRTKDSSKEPNWISNEYSQQLVHKMRSEEQSILVGTNTALNDNPSLTVRSWQGKQPVRIVVDKNNRLQKNLQLFNGMVRTIVISQEAIPIKSIENVVSDFSSGFAQDICDALYENEIQSVIIEGGAKTLKSFIESGLWDEAFVFEGVTVKFGKGLRAPKLKMRPETSTNIKNDVLHHYINH